MKAGAAVLLFSSADKKTWDYQGVLFETTQMGPVLECPDLFPVEDKWVLCFSRMDQPQRVTFVVGDFDGQSFTPEYVQHPAVGPNFYAPQTFTDPKGRRILIGWITPWGLPEGFDTQRSGSMTIPLEVTMNDAERLCLFPVEEAQPLLKTESPLRQAGGPGGAGHRWGEAPAGAARPGGVGRAGPHRHPHRRGVRKRRGAVPLLLPPGVKIPKEKAAGDYPLLFVMPKLPSSPAAAGPAPGTAPPPGRQSPAPPRGTGARCPGPPPGW